MKFTTEDACKELTSKIPTNGEKLHLSDRSIKEQVESLLPLITSEDTELTDFVDKVLPIMRTANANVRNDVSVGIRDYKEKNPAQPPKKDDVTPPKENDDDVTSKLLKRIEDLEKRNAENERKETLSSRRKTIADKLVEKGCKDKDWIKDFLEEVSLDGEDFDVDARVEKYIKVYNKSEAKFNPDTTPKQTGGNVEDKVLKNTIDGAAAYAKAQRLDD